MKYIAQNSHVIPLNPLNKYSIRFLRKAYKLIEFSYKNVKCNKLAANNVF